MRIGGWEILLFLVLGAIIVVPFWRLFQRTGHSGALGLLMMIPLANLIMLYVLAFGDWPVDAELRRERRQVGRL